MLCLLRINPFDIVKSCLLEGEGDGGGGGGEGGGGGAVAVVVAATIEKGGETGDRRDNPDKRSEQTEEGRR